MLSDEMNFFLLLYSFILVRNGPCLVAFVWEDFINGSGNGDSSLTSCVIVALMLKLWKT